MKKKFLLKNYDEINLIELSKIIWNDKIKILLITIILFLLGLGYSYQKPNIYLVSLKIIKNNNFSLLNVDYLNELLKNKNYKINVTDQFLFDIFSNELEDHKEFLLNLKNKDKIEEDISILSSDLIKENFLKYRDLLKITKNKSHLILSFEWDNIDEAKDILRDTINLTLFNSKRLLHKKLDFIIENEDKRIHTKNLRDLTYLEKQKLIAKELNIVEIPHGYSGNPFYLRGYVAIDKEIDLINDMTDIELEVLNKEIDILKKADLGWIKYDVDIITTKSLKYTKLILITSIFLGLILGILFVLIRKIPQFLKVSK